MTNTNEKTKRNKDREKNMRRFGDNNLDYFTFTPPPKEEKEKEEKSLGGEQK